jgi:hypothetical protein
VKNNPQKAPRTNIHALVTSSVAQHGIADTSPARRIARNAAIGGESASYAARRRSVRYAITTKDPGKAAKWNEGDAARAGPALLEKRAKAVSRDPAVVTVLHDLRRHAAYRPQKDAKLF